MKIQITADSTLDLTQELIERFDIIYLDNNRIGYMVNVV